MAIHLFLFSCENLLVHLDVILPIVPLGHCHREKLYCDHYWVCLPAAFLLVGKCRNLEAE